MRNRIGWKLISDGNSLLRCLNGKSRQSLVYYSKGSVLSGNVKPAVTRYGCVPNSPWKVLFFGSDDFAVESLKQLHALRGPGADSVVDSLEVVTLSDNVPVQKFAEQHELRIHKWPNVDLSGRFHVGVVVSFGCLLQESLINKLPYGILNVHPSLLPRWRGPAPVFHTILHGDKLTGVTIMQIRPKRFDVGPILSQELYEIPERCTADELGSSLAVLGAQLLIDTLRYLPERIANRREQDKESATFAHKINSSMSWLVWEEQTCDQIDRLYRAIGSRIPLRTLWMGHTIKLLDFVGKCKVPFTEGSHSVVAPGSIHYQRETKTLLVCCKDNDPKHTADAIHRRFVVRCLEFLHNLCAGRLGWIQNGNVKETIISGRFLQWIPSPERPDEIAVPEQPPVPELRRETRRFSTWQELCFIASE